MNSLPKWLKEITYVMEHVDADVRGIEENLQHALKTEETGPNLTNEIKSVRSALEAVKSSLAIMDEATQHLVKDVAVRVRPHRASFRQSGRESNCQTIRDRRIEVAAAVLRLRYPRWSEARIRNKAVLLAARIYVKTISKSIDDPVISDVETGVHERGGFQFRREPKRQRKEDKYIPFTYGSDPKSHRKRR